MNSNSKLHTLCLTPDQISDLLIADDRATLSLASRRRHLEECPACSAEFAQMEALLIGFRESALTGAAQASERTSAQALRLSHGFASRPVALRGVLWVASAAALAVAVTFPLLHHATPLKTGAGVAAISSPASASTVADEALLDGITQDLSASVPSSMQSLDDPAGNATQPAIDDDATRR